MKSTFSKNSGKYFIIIIVFFLARGIVFSADIHEFAKKGDVNNIQILLKLNKEMVNLKDKNGKTALHFASQWNQLEAIKFLLENGADINVKNSNGVTPLHYASFMGHENSVKLLIKYKADLNIIDKVNRTAIDFAIVAKRKNVVELLIDNGIKIDLKEKGPNFIHLAAANGFEKLLNLIIKKGGDLHSLNVFGGTLLHSAVLGELPNVVKFLLSKKISIEQVDKYGKTAVYYAGTIGNKIIIDAFKKVGAQVREEPKVLLKGEYFGQKPPGNTAELFAPQMISRNGGNERDIAFSNDGNLFFFSRDSKIMEVKRKDGVWGDPKPAPFSSEFPEFEAYFTPDNKRIYFISKRPKDNGNKPSPWELWFSDRVDDGWSNAKLINSQFKGCFYTSFTKDWKMYYTGPDNNIYSSQFKKGKFEKPRKLGSNINTKAAEYNSFIAPDESYLIFTSFGWGKGFGNGDLFISFRGSKGQWSRPVNMGPEINSKFHEYCPLLSPDGKYFFFTSNRLGNEDIYWIESKVIMDLKKNSN